MDREEFIMPVKAEVVVYEDKNPPKDRSTGWTVEFVNSYIFERVIDLISLKEMDVVLSEVQIGQEVLIDGPFGTCIATIKSEEHAESGGMYVCLKKDEIGYYVTAWIDKRAILKADF